MDFSLLILAPTAVFLKQLIKPVVGIVDDERRRAGKVLVRPRVGEHMHGDADRLRALSLGEHDGLPNQISVRSANQAIFVFVALGALPFRLGVQVVGEKVEGRPNARDILQADNVRRRLHQFQLQLCCCGGERRIHLAEKGHAAQIHKLVAARNGNAFFMRITRKLCRAVGGVVVKIRIHTIASFWRFCRLMRRSCTA